MRHHFFASGMVACNWKNYELDSKMKLRKYKNTTEQDFKNLE